MKRTAHQLRRIVSRTASGLCCFGRIKAPAIASEIVVNTFHILGNFGSGYMFVVGEIGRPKQNRIHVNDDDRNDHCGVCERK